MRLNPGVTVLAAAVVAVSACEQSTGTASLDTQDQRASYAVGRDIGRNLAPAEGRLDMAAFRRGIEDAMADRESPVPEDSLRAALQAFSASIDQAERERRSAQAEANREAGEAYLAENAAREAVVTTESGLQYEVLEEGDGPRPGPGDRVRVHYRGTLPDGTEFDSSMDGDPAEFGLGGVIPGFSEALQLMPVGSRYRVVIPGDLAYGPRGSGARIGPNQTLVFELELIEIVE